ncbi:MAG: hypothetical protein ACI8PG_003385 [Planctomycetota bacterium]|jgi:uncharacterized protein (DUF342 family)
MSVRSSLPNEIDQRQSIAAAMHCSADTLQELRPGPEAGEDAGCIFYARTLGETTLAVRNDAARAYITQFNSGLSNPHTEKTLSECGLVRAQLPHLWEVQSKTATAQQWIKVADCISNGLKFIEPIPNGNGLDLQALHALDEALHALWNASDPDAIAAGRITAQLSLPGDQLVRSSTACDIFGRPLNTSFQQPEQCIQWIDGVCHATLCSYVYIREEQIAAIPPIWIDPSHLHAYFVALAGPVVALEPHMLEEAIATLDITEGINNEDIQRLCQNFRAGKLAPGFYLVAKGQEAQPGRDAQLDIFVAQPDPVPAPRPMEVRANQRVARRIPPTKGKSGCDLLGKTLPADHGLELTAYAGANLWIEHEGQSEIFYAGEDGALKINGEELAVIRLLKLNGDVNFRTGNLSFGGQVFIDGSLRPSFCVEAGEGITIVGDIERGASVKARGDILVGGQIEGHRTGVESGGSISAPHIREARVSADGDIRLATRAYQAELRAGHSLLGNQADKSASVVGGQAWAGMLVDLYSAGDEKGICTILVAGLSPEKEKHMDKLRQQAMRSRTHILHLLEHFYLDKVDVGQIQNLINAATGPQRRLLANYANRLGELVRVYQKISGEHQQLQRQLDTEVGAAEIRIHHVAYAGVIIRISGYERTLNAPKYRTRFFVRDGQLLDEPLSTD